MFIELIKWLCCKAGLHEYGPWEESVNELFNMRWWVRLCEDCQHQDATYLAPGL